MRREYIVRQRRVDDYIYRVTASTKKEAMRMVDEHEVDYDDVQGHDCHKAKVIRIDMYDDCPNKGEGWSEIPLDKLKDVKIGSFHWHYNGKCRGEKAAEKTHCYGCESAMKSGHRLLTDEEKEYLNKAYSVGFTVEVMA
jgi:hypothetical protein